MAYKQKTELNEEQILSYLKEIVAKIRTEEDPLELNAYRRLFRMAVPFTLRSYFASYLLKQLFAGKPSGRNGMPARNDRSPKAGKKERNENRPVRQEEIKRGKPGDSRRTEVRANEVRSNEVRSTSGHLSEKANAEVRPGEPRAGEPRIVLADDVSTTLFLSIGRNRRVYPRDLIGLMMQTAEIEREHIGEIRVLDNYSFVQVITEDAEKIISTLNDFEYRGRKLAVSYSRKREDEPLGANPDAATREASLSESRSDTEADEDLDAEGEIPASDSWISQTDGPDDEEDNADI